MDACISSDSEDDADYIPPENVGSYCDESESEQCAQSVSESRHLHDLKEDSKVYRIEEKKHAEEVWNNFLGDISKTENTKTLHNSENENEPLSFSTSKLSELNRNMSKNSKSLDCTITSKVSAPIRNPSKHLSGKRINVDSILQTVQSKKKKASVLQKSLNDWNNFKKSEGIEEDIAQFNKGKQAFLERQRFLERSELRCFQTEQMLKQSLKKA